METWRPLYGLPEVYASPDSTATIRYLEDDRNLTGHAQVLEERDGSDTTVVTYVYALDLVSQKRGSAIHYYGNDGQGTVRYLTDGTPGSATLGQITDTYTYDAFGILIHETHAAAGATPNNYLYCGEQWDPDLGMYYLRARYYRPELGRFWGMDTYAGHHRDPSSLHQFLYCNSDPVNRLDLSGRMSTSEIMSAGLIIADVASQMQGSIAMAYGRLRKGSWPDAFGIGFYGSAPHVEAALHKCGFYGNGGVSLIGGAYAVFQPKKKRVSLYLWDAWELSATVGFPSRKWLDFEPEWGAFETWIWKYDERHETDMRPLGTIGLSFGGSLYGGDLGASTIGENQYLLGVTDSIGTGGFALITEGATEVVSFEMSKQAMAASVALAHSVVGYGQGATINPRVDSDPASSGLALVGNAFVGAAWVNSAYGTGKY